MGAGPARALGVVAGWIQCLEIAASLDYQAVSTGCERAEFGGGRRAVLPRGYWY